MAKMEVAPRCAGIWSYCVRCPRISGRRVYVSVLVSYGGEALCPSCALDAIEEAGLTLNEAMGIRVVAELDEGEPPLSYIHPH